MTNPDVVDDPTSVRDASELGYALRSLRNRSSYSYKALASEIDRPTSTVHGWFSGRHLPYRRDNDDFAAALSVLGVADTDPWLAALARCRDLEADPTGTERVNPYRGLEEYRTADAGRFFGRATETAALLDRLGEKSFHPLVVIGPSGSGKSSLLRAGVIAAIGERATVCVTPGVDLRGVRDRIVAAVDSATNDTSAGGVVIVDQFEEIFGSDPDEAEALHELLSTLARRPDCEVVIGLRDDFFDEASKHEWLRDGLRHRAEIVSAPSIDRLPELIVAPAKQAGFDIEPALVARLTVDFSHHAAGQHAAGALPLLSYVLYQLVESTESGSGLTVERYEAIGGIERNLDNAAEAAYASLSADGQRRCELLFKQMVELGPDSVPTCTSVDLNVIERVIPDADDFHDVLGRYTAARILIADRDWVSISHEALITSWRRLAEWVREERRSLEMGQQLRTARRVWAESGHDRDALLADRRLASARELLDDPIMAVRLGQPVLDFVRASDEVERQSIRRRRRRTRAVGALAVVAVIAAGLATTFAVSANRATERAEQASDDALSRQIALESVVLRDSDPGLGQQLALVAAGVSSTVDSRSALVDATAGARTARFVGGSGSTALAVTADGTRMAYSNSVDGSIRVMHTTESGEIEEEFTLQYDDPEVDVYALAFSPDGNLLLSGGTDLYVTMWDLAGDRVPQRLDDSLTAFTLPVQSISVSADGGTAYGAGTGEGIGVYDLTGDPTESSELIPAPGSTMAIDVDSERGLLAAGQFDGTVLLFDLDDPAEPLFTTPSIEGSTANSIDLSPAGDLLAVGYRSGVFRVWDVTDPQAPLEIETGMEPFGTWVHSLEFTPDGAILAAGSDSVVRTWDTESWAVTGASSYPTVVTHIAFVGDREAMVTVADGSMRSVDLAEPAFQAFGASIWSISYSTDGRLLAASSRDKTLVWEPDGATLGEPVATILPVGDDGYSGTNAISPDGRWMSLGTRSGAVVVADLNDLEGAANGSSLQVLPDLPLAIDELTDTTDNQPLVENMGFSHNSSILAAVGGEGFTQLWTVSASGDFEPAARFQFDGVARNVVFDGSAPLMAVNSDNGLVLLYDVSDPTQPVEVSQIVSGTDLAYGVAFHPEIEAVAVGNADGSMSIWDIADPADPVLMSSINGPTTRLYGMDFDTTGDRLVAAVGDNTAWVWDTTDPAAPELDLRLSLPETGLYAAMFSPDGERLVAAGADGRVYLWTLDTDLAREATCSAAGEGITEAEWDTLVETLDYAPPCSD